tara:strand:- start:248 stop:499 length:252 start_codon:yes stop_codon:yes gene_type:complete
MAERQEFLLYQTLGAVTQQAAMLTGIHYLIRQDRFAVVWAINDLIIIMDIVQDNKEELGLEEARVTAKLVQVKQQAVLVALVL